MPPLASAIRAAAVQAGNDGNVILVRCVASITSLPRGAALPPDGDALFAGKRVDGLTLRVDDLVLLAHPDGGPSNGVWCVTAAGPIRPAFVGPGGEELSYVNRPGLTTLAAEGGFHGGTVFVCVQYDANTGAATFAEERRNGIRYTNATVAIDDLRDGAATALADGTLVLGSTALGSAAAGAIGPNNVVVGLDTLIGADLGPAASGNTLIGRHPGAAAAVGRVVVTDGVGNAALAAVPGRTATWCGPAAHRVFECPTDADHETSWVGGCTAAADVRAGATVLADGDGNAVLAACHRADRNNAWIGPGCKRLFSSHTAAADAASNSLWLGGTKADEVLDGHGDSVVVADAAGTAVAVAQCDAARNNVFLGPNADALFSAAGVGQNNTFVGGVPAAEVHAKRNNAVVVADGAGVVRLRVTENGALQLGPAVDVASAPIPTGNSVHLGHVVPSASDRTAETVLADGNGSVVLYTDAAGNAALGAPAAGDLRTRARQANAAGHPTAYANAVAIGSVAPPAPADFANPDATAAGACCLSNGAQGLVLYTDHERAYLGVACPEDGTTGGDIAARYDPGIVLGRNPNATAASVHTVAGPITLADPATGAVRWHADVRGRVSWSISSEGATESAAGTVLPAADGTLALVLDGPSPGPARLALHLRDPNTHDPLCGRPGAGGLVLNPDATDPVLLVNGDFMADDTYFGGFNPVVLLGPAGATGWIAAGGAVPNNLVLVRSGHAGILHPNGNNFLALIGPGCFIQQTVRGQLRVGVTYSVILYAWANILDTKIEVYAKDATLLLPITDTATSPDPAVTPGAPFTFTAEKLSTVLTLRASFVATAETAIVRIKNAAGVVHVGDIQLVRHAT